MPQTAPSDLFDFLLDTLEALKATVSLQTLLRGKGIQISEH